MTRVQWAGALGRTVLLPLAFCVLASFSLPCGLVIDGHANTGDETMTIALTSDISFTAPAGPLPGYGYQSDGQRWTWGLNTAPLYGWFYAAAVHAAPPLRRVETARLVSRVLGGAAIYLITLALLQLVFRRTPFATPLPAQLLLALFVAFVFMNSPRFRFIASFARLEALGLFFLAAVIAAGSRLLLKPTGRSAFLFTLLALSAAWTSYVAFYLATFIAAFSLVAYAVTRFPRSASLAAIRSFLVSTALPALSALVIFAAMSSWFSSALLSGPASSRMSVMLGELTRLGRAPAGLFSGLTMRPEPLWFLGASVCGVAVLLAGRRVLDAQTRLAPLIWVSVALVATTIVYQFWIATMGQIRFTYDLLITTAFAFLQLAIFCFILRDRAVERYVMAAATAAALLYASLHASGSGCLEDFPVSNTRLWPFQHTVSAGLYNPFDESANPWNRARRLHAGAARAYLLQHGVTQAMATDPMFATMSDAALQFYFLNDQFKALRSPAAEQELLSVFVSQKGMRYIASTDFGVSATMDSVGLADLRRCLKQGGGLCQLGGQSVEVARVFRTDEAVSEPGAYSYGVGDSTPITIYLISMPK